MVDGAAATVICLTPVKSEAWVLDMFLRCTSLWADHIIISDQQSEDESREIARRYPKVTLLENPTSEYSEVKRQQQLIAAARAIPCPGKRILIALDADEILTANVLASAEWQKVLDAPEGTELVFAWPNVTPDLKAFWFASYPRPTLGFVDDGSPHRGGAIHATRVPTPGLRPPLVLEEIAVMHFAYFDWERWRSRNRWYQCWEHLHGKRLHRYMRPIRSFRLYNNIDHYAATGQQSLPLEWISGFEEAGIDLRPRRGYPYYHWDRDIVQMFIEYGPKRFRKLPVWDVDWLAKCQAMGLEISPSVVRDPRTRFEKAVHTWLTRTQPQMNHPGVRSVQRALRIAGW